jgi:hypothetical protein
MAYGQIDPARLQGDALTQWYQRSPADIEDQRQVAAAQRYDDFFGGSFAQSQAPDQDNQSTDKVAAAVPLPASDATNSTTRPIEPVPSFSPRADVAIGPAEADLATANAQSVTQVAATAWPCLGCHGTGISPFPPAFSKPPWATPWRPTPDLTPRKPAKPHPSQCAMQNMRDSRICSREPNSTWQAVCLESAAEREAHCISTDGEVGWPPLETHDRR